MTKVRVTMHPDREYEVGPQEYLDLSRQGLLVEGKGHKAPDLTGTNTLPPATTELPEGTRAPGEGA